MNAADNDWIRDVRKRVVAARKKAEEKLAAKAGSSNEPGDEDLRNR